MATLLEWKSKKKYSWADIAALAGFPPVNSNAGKMKVYRHAMGIMKPGALDCETYIRISKGAIKLGDLMLPFRNKADA